MELFFPVSPEERDALLRGRFGGPDLSGMTRIESDTSGALGDAQWVVADLAEEELDRYEDPYPVDVGFREFVLPVSVLSRLQFRAVPVAEVVASDADLTNYVEAAEAHGSATLTGESQRANNAHDEIVEARRRLRARGSEELLLLLLEHVNPGVVMWAGAHVLEFDSERGERALAKLSDRNDLIGFSAGQTLKAWRLGKLSFP